MAESGSEGLLPLGKELVSNQRQPFMLLQRLSSGLTGEVYRGELQERESEPPIPVAVKARRPLRFEGAAESFRQEKLTLSLLRHHEEVANKQQRLSLLVTPTYYGDGQHDGVDYLLMELMAGRQIPDLLKEQEKLPEAQALTIGWHLCRTLHLMHEHLNKSYIDLKLENLWWEERAAGGQLKLTDFGTLEEIRDAGRRGVQRDLMLAGVYLCVMITGYTLNYSIGLLREPAGPVIRRSAMSWGARRLLRHLLHPYPEARLRDVSQAAEQLRVLFNFWQVERPDELVRIAETNLQMAQSSSDAGQARNFAARAVAAVDIARLKGGQTEQLAELAKQSEHLYERADYPEVGRSLLAGGSYKAAREKFEEGVHWSDEPAELRRWAYLAMVGEQAPAAALDEYRGELDAVVIALNEGRWAAARERIAQLPATLHSAGLDALRADAGLFAGLEEASRAQGRDFRLAAKRYRQAHSELSGLPEHHRRFIANEEVGDLLALAQQQDDLEASRGQAASRLAELIRNGSQANLLPEARDALALDRDNPERQRDVETLTTMALERQDYPLAADLAGLAFLAPRPALPLVRLAALASALEEATADLSRGELRLALMRLQRLDLQSDPQTVAAPVLAMVQKLASHAEQQSDPEFLRDLQRLVRPLSPEKASELADRAADLEQTQTEALRKRVDKLHIQLANLAAAEELAWLRWQESLRHLPLREYLARLQDPPARWQRMAKLAAEAEPLAEAAAHRLEEVRGLRNLAARRLQALAGLGAERAVAKEAAAGALRHLRSEWSELARLMQPAGEATMVGPGSRQPADSPLQSRLGDLIRSCYDYLVRIDANEASVEEILRSALDAAGPLSKAAAAELRRQADGRLAQLQRELDDAHQAYEQGRPDEALALLEALRKPMAGDKLYEALQQQARRALEWQAWQREHLASISPESPDRQEQLQRELYRWLGYRLPAVYWRDSPAGRYLTGMAQQAADEVRGHQHDYRQPGYIRYLRQWLQAEWLRRMALQNESIEGDAGNGQSPPAAPPGWWPDHFLSQAHQAVARRDHDQLTEAVRLSPLPGLDRFSDALDSLSEEKWWALHREPAAGRPAWFWALAGVGVVLSLIGAGVLALQIPAVDRLFGGEPAATAQVAVVPTATVAFFTPVPPPTAATAPTATPTPTETPTATATQSPTPTEISPNASVFFVAEPASVAPAVPLTSPAGSDVTWLVSASDTESQPPLSDAAVWQQSVLADGRSFYFATPAEGQRVAATWVLDQPLNAGLYALYALDTLDASAGQATYQVLLDSAPATAFRGLAEVIFDDPDHGQSQEEWLPLGLYQAGQSQTLVVQANGIGPRQFPLAATPLLIQKVNLTHQGLLETLPAGRLLVSLLDDDRASFSTATDSLLGSFAPTDRQMSRHPSELAWNGGLHSRQFDPTLDYGVRVEWRPVGRLAAGTYELYVLVPAEQAGVTGEYVLLANGNPISRETPSSLNQADHRGQWASLGLWALAEEAAVGVRLTVASVLGQAAAGAVGADAVAIVRLITEE